MISVIVVTRGIRTTLPATIDSVFKQTELCELIISQGKGTFGENFNRGLEKVTQPYVRFVADDDLLPRKSCERVIDFLLQANGSPRFIIGNAINFKKYYWYRYKSRYTGIDDLLHVNTIHGGTCVWKTSCVREIGGMNENLWTAEEYEFNLRFIREFGAPIHIDENLYKYRLHDNQKSVGKHTDTYKMKRAKEVERIRNEFRQSSKER